MTFITTKHGYINTAHVARISGGARDAAAVVWLADGTSCEAIYDELKFAIQEPTHFLPAEPGTFALVTDWNEQDGFNYYRERVMGWGFVEGWPEAEKQARHSCETKKRLNVVKAVG